MTALLAESSLSSAGDRSGWKGVVGEPVRNGEPERPQARPDLTPRDAVAPQPKGGGRPSRKTIRTHTTGAFETHDLASAEGAAEFVLFLAVTPYGRIRLGADDDRPEFRTVSWIAMMFSAGMGIGLMFFGVAEPISHLAAPPLGLARPGTEAAAAKAIEYTYFHWALHPWALYAVVGLALGYFCFRRGMPNLINSVFYPLLG